MARPAGRRGPIARRFGSIHHLAALVMVAASTLGVLPGGDALAAATLDVVASPSLTLDVSARGRLVRVAGQIVDELGDPLVGLPVGVELADDGADGMAEGDGGPRSAATVTDTMGRYAVERRVAPGRYRVEVRVSGDAFRQARTASASVDVGEGYAELHLVTAGGEPADASVLLAGDAACTVPLQAVAAVDGEPAPGLWVVVDDVAEACATAAPAQTDDTGRAALTVAVPAAGDALRCEFAVRLAGEGVADDAVTSASIRRVTALRLDAAEGFTDAGERVARVAATADGAPLQGVALDVIDAASTQTARTDAAGRAQILLGGHRGDEVVVLARPDCGEAPLARVVLVLDATPPLGWRGRLAQAGLAALVLIAVLGWAASLRARRAAPDRGAPAAAPGVVYPPAGASPPTAVHVVDADTGAPIADASLAAGDAVVRTDAHGRLDTAAIAALGDGPCAARAAGYVALALDAAPRPGARVHLRHISAEAREILREAVGTDAPTGWWGSATIDDAITRALRARPRLRRAAPLGDVAMERLEAAVERALADPYDDRAALEALGMLVDVIYFGGRPADDETLALARRLGAQASVRPAPAASLLPGLAIALLVGGAAAPRAAAAEVYDPASSDWDGLRSLVALAAEHQVALEPVDSVDLVGRDTSRPLLLVYPTVALPVDALLDWVEAGGALVVADDFGEATALLSALGVERVEAPQHGTLYLEQAFLPLLVPAGAHELSDRTARIVLNQPSGLRGRGPGVFEFDDGTSAVLDLSLGAGVVVLVSDPSAFMNLMLPVESNAALATQVLGRVCRDAVPCTVDLARGGTPIAGAARARSRPQVPEPATLLAAARRLVEARLDARAQRVAALGLALAAALLLWLAYPVRGPLRVSTGVRSMGPPPLTEMERAWLRLQRDPRRASYHGPATALARQIASALPASGTPGQIAAELLRRSGRAHGLASWLRLRRTVALAVRLARARLRAGEAPPSVSRTELGALIALEGLAEAGAQAQPGIAPSADAPPARAPRRP